MAALILAQSESFRDTQPLASIRSVSEAVIAHSGQIDALAINGRSNNDAAASACKLCLLIFGPIKVVEKSNPSYFTGVNENCRSQNCHLPAACILKPTTAVDVAIMLRVVRDLDTKFSVRSGGQNPNPGFGSIGTDGVLIDLANMSTSRISADRSTVAVEPGARWGNIYKYLDPFGLSAVGSRSPVPGVGGFLAGGGIPFIPSLTGLGCDNVKNFEIVLGNSTIINANATSSSDLFLALKGGGSNYGIITRYDLYTSSLHNIWYHFSLYNQSDSTDILAATFEVQKAMENDPKAHFIWVASGGSILIGQIYGQWTKSPPVFRQFASLRPSAPSIPETNGTVSSLSQALDFLYSIPATREIFGFSHNVDLRFYQETFENYKSMAKFSDTPGTDLSYTIQPIGKATITLGKARGGNSLGIEAIEQTWFNSVAQFSLAKDGEAARKALKELSTTMTRKAKQNHIFLPFIFYNDASKLQGQDPLGSYGKTNLLRLQRASRKYDPDQVFQDIQFDGFKIRDSQS